MENRDDAPRERDAAPKPGAPRRKGVSPKPGGPQRKDISPKPGAPRPVMLVHGFGQTPTTWDDAAALLEADGAFACARFDVGACCGQPLGEVCRALDGQLRALAAQSGQPVGLVGYSMGGRIALDTIVRAQRARQPLPLAGLVLESAGLGPASAEEREALAARNGAWAAQARAEGARAFMERWAQLPLFASQRALPPARRALLAAERQAATAASLAWQQEALGAHRQASRTEGVEALAALAATGVPTSYLAGALDQKYVAVARGLGEDAGSAIEVIIVPNSGHNVHFEQPEPFAAAVRGLLG